MGQLFEASKAVRSASGFYARSKLASNLMFLRASNIPSTTLNNNRSNIAGAPSTRYWLTHARTHLPVIPKAREGPKIMPSRQLCPASRAFSAECLICHSPSSDTNSRRRHHTTTTRTACITHASFPRGGTLAAFSARFLCQSLTRCRSHSDQRE